MDDVEAPLGPEVHDSQPAPVVILAVDTTPDSAHLEGVKTALVEVRGWLLLQHHCFSMQAHRVLYLAYSYWHLVWVLAFEAMHACAV